MPSFEKEPEIPDDLPMSPAKRWFLFGALGVVVLAAAGGGYWWFAKTRAARVPPTLAQAEAIKQIGFLDERLRSIRAALSDLGPDGAPEMQRALIEEAVTRQNELMRVRPSPDGEDAIRLHEWQTKLDDLNVAAWGRESRALEQQAAERLRAGEAAASIQDLKEALRLQRQINASSARQSAKNYGRESRLQQDIEGLEADPLLEEVRRLTEAGRVATAAGNWAEAVAAYERARVVQVKLNQDYPRTRFANTIAVERIDVELATLGAAEAHEAMQGFLREAREAAAAQKMAEAEALLNQAEERQRVINADFAKSRFVSMERFEEIEIERQTLRARATLSEVQELDRRATAHLRRRELFQAQKLFAEALQQFESVATLYPKARGLDQAMKQRLTYLNLRQAELVQIQDQLYDLLVPLPGNERVALLKTEVPQALYLRVMNTNPSRNPGRLLPVDSVTFGEAEEFCRRLGWVLGLPVRLPTEAEFKAAVGPAVATAGANAWTASNSAGKTQAAAQKTANAAGFYDLLGNVAEWLAGGDGENGLVAGGNYTDTWTQPDAVPVKSVAKAERARTQGLRVVVEIDLAAPLAK